MTSEASRRGPQPELSISEATWQEQVIEVAHLYGWSHLHVRRTIGRGRKWVTATNLAGWPDLFMWHPVARRRVAAELKSEGGSTTPEQDAVLASLGAAGVEIYVWRPSDLPAVQAALNTRGAIPNDRRPE